MRRAVAAVVIAVVGTGCGGGEPTVAVPQGPFAQALAETGGGGAHGSLGVGWADPELVRQSGAGADLIEAAIMPNAGTLIERNSALERRFGFDPARSESLVSVGGSYAFGLRMNGVDAGRLRRALVAEGARTERRDGIELLEIGDYAVVPKPLLDAGVNGLGAADAFGPDLTVLAISDRARAALLGQGGRLIDEPVYRAAADCLGDAVAARVIPDKHILGVETGVDVFAVGLRGDGSEALCAVGGTAERADQIARALEGSLAAEARAPEGGEPIAQDLADAVISRGAFDGVEYARAELTRAADRDPGYVFGTISSGTIVSLINGTDRIFEE